MLRSWAAARRDVLGFIGVYCGEEVIDSSVCWSALLLDEMSDLPTCLPVTGRKLKGAVVQYEHHSARCVRRRRVAKEGIESAWTR